MENLSKKWVLWKQPEKVSSFCSIILLMIPLTKGPPFYRLTAVDLDGSFSYSDLAEVYLDWQTFYIYPNPPGLNRQLFAEIQSLEPQQLELEVTAVSGKVVQRKLIQMQQNEIRISLDLSGLPAGLYLVKVSDESHHIY